MAEFGFAGHGSVINLTVHHHTSPNPAAYCNIKNMAVAPTGSMQSFAEGRHVGIILYPNGLGLRLFLKPAHQVYPSPTLNLVGGAYLASFIVDRTTKSHANSGWGLMKLPECLSNKIQNPFGSFLLIYGIAKPLLHLSRPVSREKLHFGSAYFDS